MAFLPCSSDGVTAAAASHYQLTVLASAGPTPKTTPPMKKLLALLLVAGSLAAQAAQAVPDSTSSDDVWYLLGGPEGCTPAFRAAAELGVQASSAVTPQQFAALLERSSGMQASITDGGDRAPTMVFLRRPGNRGIADDVFTLVKSEARCRRLAGGTRATSRPAASELPPAPAPAPSPARSTPSRGPSFDCSKAKSLSEKLICSDDELAGLDVKLSEALAIAMKATADPAELHRASVAAWRQRERQCRDRQCLLDWFNQRLNALR